MDIQVDPKIFHEFYQKIAMRIRPPVTTRTVLEEFADADVNSEAIAKAVQRNQYCEYMLMQVIKSLGGGSKENEPSLQAAIVLLGMSGTRDFVCALQQIRNIARKFPELDAKGKPQFKSKDLLKYAIKTEEYVTVRKLPNPDLAYAAGLMFDFMLAISRDVFQSPEGFEEFLVEVYRHGLKSAMIGFNVARAQKHIGSSKFIFPSCLIHDVGKLAMYLLYPKSVANSYAAFREELAKKPLSREVTYFMERKRFGMTHEYFSAQLAHDFQIFRSIDKAILFHHAPYLTKGHKDTYMLAALIALASNVANNFRVPKDVTDPIFAAWFSAELKDFKFDPAAMLKIMQRLGSETF